MLVREYIDFERGKDPKIAMGLGLPTLVDKWIKKAYGDWETLYQLDDDGFITWYGEFEIPDADLSPGFPSYIRFKAIQGAIHLDFTGLEYLSGLPKVCNEYFSCEGNKLSSLEGCPEIVKGDFFCRGNPGKFTKADVEKVCKVGGKIYAQDSNVDESIKGMDFERTGVPYSDLNMGRKIAIQKWLNSMNIDSEDYTINDDFTIDSFSDINLINKEIEELPSYINFREIHGSFYAGGNPWKSLRGFPSIIQEDLQINSPSVEKYYLNKFTEEEIRKIIKVHGDIYIN